MICHPRGRKKPAKTDVMPNLVDMFIMLFSYGADEFEGEQLYLKMKKIRTGKTSNKSIVNCKRAVNREGILENFWPPSEEKCQMLKKLGEMKQR